MSAVEYIFVTMLLTNIMLGSIFLVSWLSISRKPYVLYWSLAFWMAVVNILLNAGRAIFSSPEIYWLIVNLTSLIVQTLSLAGFRQRVGFKPIPLWVIFYVIIIELLIIYFTLIDHHMGIRVAIMPYSAVLMAAACIFTINRVSRKLRAAEWGIVIIYSIFAMLQFIAATAALLQGAEADQYYYRLYQQINFLAMPAAYSGLGLFAVLMLADDLAAKMRYLAYHDPLTKLFNRRGIKEEFSKLIGKNSANELPLFVVLADIDHFKEINDNYGHQVGDYALQQFSTLLTGQIRCDDIVGRLGGEEFVIILQVDDLSAAEHFTERLRECISDHLMAFDDYSVSMTASFGVIQLDEAYDDIFDAINDADELLYTAKQTGRNKVIVASSGV